MKLQQSFLMFSIADLEQGRLGMFEVYGNIDGDYKKFKAPDLADAIAEFTRQKMLGCDPTLWYANPTDGWWYISEFREFVDKPTVTIGEDLP